MEILVFVIVPAILVGIFKGLADWTPPGGSIGGRDAFLYYVSIILVSLAAFLVSSLHRRRQERILGQGIHRSIDLAAHLVVYFYGFFLEVRLQTAAPVTRLQVGDM